MDELHIEDFCKDTACTLLTLYKRFPVKTTVYVEDICGPDTPDDFGLHSPRHMAGFGAIAWLAEEGIVRYAEALRQEAFEELILTQESFLHLAAQVPSTESVQSRANELHDMLRDASSITLRDYILALLNALATFTSKSYAE
ncbi:MAG: hypothetical protein ACI93R_000596 [Flavobacteriales bacterium]|jgi:hypothetical protein